MSGEYILKFLQDTTARVEFADRWMVCSLNSPAARFYIYEMKPYPRTFVTADEEEACQILKGD